MGKMTLDRRHPGKPSGSALQSTGGGAQGCFEGGSSKKRSWTHHPRSRESWRSCPSSRRPCPPRHRPPNPHRRPRRRRGHRSAQSPAHPAGRRRACRRRYPSYAAGHPWPNRGRARGRAAGCRSGPGSTRREGSGSFPRPSPPRSLGASRPGVERAIRQGPVGGVSGPTAPRGPGGQWCLQRATESENGLAQRSCAAMITARQLGRAGNTTSEAGAEGCRPGGWWVGLGWGGFLPSTATRDWATAALVGRQGQAR